MQGSRLAVLAVIATGMAVVFPSPAQGHVVGAAPLQYLQTPSTGTSLRAPGRDTVYACLGSTLVRPRRPWINPRTGVLEVKKRPFVEGSVEWNSRFRIRLTPTRRHFKGNGLPTHPTGRFPVRRGTAAYDWYAALPATGYDNAAEIPIEPWDLDFSVPRFPQPNAQPRCIGRLTTGIAKTGAPFHVEIAFDSKNNLLDPNSALPLDRCWGHPYDGQYHYHGPSYACFEKQFSNSRVFTGGTRNHAPLVGWAIDGFGVYGPRSGRTRHVRNRQLDECHGHTHPVEWDGRTRMMYHYHLNGEYPYSIGCFRGTPTFLPPQAN
jgi:hypothetical protein